MTRRERRTFGQDFRIFFLRGLAILLPSVLTLWIVVQAFFFVQNRVAEPINRGIRQSVIYLAPKTLAPERLPDWFTVTSDQVAFARQQRERLAQRPLPEAALRAEIRQRNFQEWWNDHWYLRGIGLIVAIVLIYLAGVVLGGFIGRRVYQRLEQFLTRVPVFKQVYPYVKQVVDFLFGGEQQLKFNRVVLVEYPRKGIWTVGLMTGGSMKDIEKEAGEGCVTIFIPSSPTPFTGYTITVPEEETYDLPISVEEALRFVVTGGVLVPEQQVTRMGRSGGGRTAGGSTGDGGSLAAATPGTMMDDDEGTSDGADEGGTSARQAG